MKNIRAPRAEKNGGENFGNLQFLRCPRLDFFPISTEPQLVLVIHTSYERSEVYAYSDVYFTQIRRHLETHRGFTT